MLISRQNELQYGPMCLVSDRHHQLGLRKGPKHLIHNGGAYRGHSGCGVVAGLCRHCHLWHSPGGELRVCVLFVDRLWVFSYIYSCVVDWAVVRGHSSFCAPEISQRLLHSRVTFLLFLSQLINAGKRLSVFLGRKKVGFTILDHHKGVLIIKTSCHHFVILCLVTLWGIFLFF